MKFHEWAKSHASTQIQLVSSNVDHIMKTFSVNLNSYTCQVGNQYNHACQVKNHIHDENQDNYACQIKINYTLMNQKRTTTMKTCCETSILTT